MIVSRKMFLVAVGLMLAIAALVLAIHPAKAAEGPRWTGVYAGASVGYASTVTQADIGLAGVGTAASIDGLGSSGGSFGLQIGADLRVDRYLVGAFADWTMHNQEWSVSSPLLPGGTLASLDIDNQWTIGGRAGVIVGETLVYGLLGYTTMQTSDIDVPLVPISFAVSEFKGWTFGGGLETHLGGNIFLAAEYRYTKFDDQTVNLIPGVVDLNLSPEVHEAKARISYKFGFDTK